MFAGYNTHYLRYDLVCSLLIVAVLYLAAIQLITPFSPLSFTGRAFFLTTFCVAFWVVAVSRDRLQEIRERPEAKKGTRLLPPDEFNKRHQGAGIGIPHTNKKGHTSLLRIKAEDEATHIQVIGDTGTGKSALFHYFLQQLADRSLDRIIIYDPSGEYWKRHSNPERGDIWLCPFSESCPYWDLAEEVVDPKKSPQLLAKSFIPPEQGGKPNFWEKGSRAIMVALLQELHRKKGSVSDMIYWMGHPDLITRLVQDSYAYHFIDSGAKEQRAGILATLATAAESLLHLPQRGRGRKRFSFADWAAKKQGWLFIGANGVAEQELLQPLIAIWFDIALRQLTQRVDNPPTWIFIDELASLNHLSSLPTAFDQSRKYNIRLCVGFQGKAQLYEYYRNLAETMLSATSTKIFLRTDNYEAAEWAAKNIGMPEMIRHSHSHSRQISGDRASVSVRKERREEYMILPNEIQNLPKRTGYLRYQGLVTPIHFDYPVLHENDHESELVEPPLLLPSSAQFVPR